MMQMYNVTDTDHDFNPLFIAKKPCPLLVFFSFLFIFDTAKLQVIKLLLSLTAVAAPTFQLFIFIGIYYFLPARCYDN